MRKPAIPAITAIEPTVATILRPMKETVEILVDKEENELVNFLRVLVYLRL